MNNNNNNKEINFFNRFVNLKFKVNNNSISNAKLEFLWNIVPIVCLFLIAVPSFSLLYVVEDFSEISYIVKVVGNQWYWSYEFINYQTDFISGEIKPVLVEFDSVMLHEDDILEHKFGFRIMEVDVRLKLMHMVNTCFLVTSNDVLHSWAVPSLGLKTDACPGRLNRLALWPYRQGVYYGQCSEICGISHSYMPIVCVVL